MEKILSHPFTTQIIVAFVCMPIYLCCCLFTITLQNINLHTKLIVMLCCRHITCSALIYSHITSPQKVKIKCIPAHPQTSLIFCWGFVSVVSQILKLFCGTSPNKNLRICLQSLNKNICTHACHQIDIEKIAFKHVTKLRLLFFIIIFPKF